MLSVTGETGLRHHLSNEAADIHRQQVLEIGSPCKSVARRDGKSFEQFFTKIR